jgi:hypothetical protein
MSETPFPRILNLRADEWVEVRSQAEILSTLDSHARLEELPFMPQMLAYCGQKFQVQKHAHKVCDTVNGTGARRLSNCVVLEGLRCDGLAYGGCEMKCTILWKEAWLKRVSDGQSGQPNPIAGCSESDIWAGTHRIQEKDGNAEPVYMCQAVQLPFATRPLSRWALWQYVEDYRSGNVGIAHILSSLFVLFMHDLAESGLGFGSAVRATYDMIQKMRGGMPYLFRRGRIPAKSKTPTANMNIQVGELVKIKKYEEILDTVDDKLNNRGMTFHAEMATHCGKTFRVSQRLKKIMNEKTGQLLVLKNECLVLEGLQCIGIYAKPIYCPRASYLYWREIWLERVNGHGVMSCASSQNGIQANTRNSS